ncbi:MAG: methionine adenosyltransferase [Clostridia bacterium]|nr:methionine adenosyltransferase [Clostridia bacterium]
MKKIITSESVNCGHPDKTCDIIADSFLDEALKQDKNCQMAVECAIKDDLLMIYGEATTTADIDYDGIAKRVLKDIGYDNEFKIIKKISCQSPNIAQAVKKSQLCANDQGIMFGYATNENAAYMPYPILLAHRIMQVYDEYRRQNSNKYFPDAKSQVSVEYDGNKAVRVDTIVVSVSHAKGLNHSEILNDLKQNVINKVLAEYNQLKSDDVKYIVNPSGDFYIWGSFSDSGCVGRKIVVDTYGGVAKVGGGCFSSKNATKVDRSGAYYARYVAKNIVANNLAEKCEVELSYAIGLKEPVSVEINTFNTEKVDKDRLNKIVKNNFNFNVQNMIDELQLLNPIYANTACYGHFGRKEFPWEKVKKLNI